VTTDVLARVETVSHVVIEVADLERSIAFYRHVLGMTIAVDRRDRRPPDIKGLLGDFAIELVELDDDPANATYAARRREFPVVWLSLAVEDAAGARDRIRAADLADAHLTSSPSGARFFSLRDPDGYLIELIELPHGARSLADLLRAAREAGSTGGVDER
jgi:catechol 2,3-dioxygenase-like lactoylglutathione lyase family enzyme